MSNRRRAADRGEFLEKLVQEYKDTKNLGTHVACIYTRSALILRVLYKEAKQQVLANLANFAYNPFNFKFLWDLDVDPQLKEFGTAGLANICLVSEDYHIRCLISCLPDSPYHTADTQMNAMTTLMYLADVADSIVLSGDLKQILMQLRTSSANKSHAPPQCLRLGKDTKPPPWVPLVTRVDAADIMQNNPKSVTALAFCALGAYIGSKTYTNRRLKEYTATGGFGSTAEHERKEQTSNDDGTEKPLRRSVQRSL
ncbi:hypothetical protein VTP01DRAFT_3175 [Rhizomucor pusillus]|uniref:uncharacterized protein n=1 Tax=Rhizomucor pusillus TaxID=4840 RepID=UPI0037425194